VARRAMNLHGCAPASLCPPFFLLRGYPGSAKLLLWGAPPSCGDSAEGGVAAWRCAPLPDELHSLGYPRSRKNGGPY
jgi:hypothetical protein